MRGVFLAAAFVLAASAAWAAGSLPSSIAIENAAVRASLGGSTNSAAYMTVVNRSARPDRLVGVACVCAARAEVHVTRERGGVTEMDAAGPVAIPAHGRLTFAPGGRHIMLSGLKAPLIDGRRQPITLRFEHAGPLTAAFAVRARIAGGEADGMKRMGDRSGMGH